MNKVIMIGRLTRDPDIRYTQGQDQMCIARFTLAVDRKGRRQEGQQNADFPSCVAFGKAGATKEMAEAFAAMAPALEEIIHNVREVMEAISMTEKQKAEAEAWRRYYRELARASNNYRRMHGMPMVHRPRGRGGRRIKPPDNLSMRLAELKEQTDRYAAGAEGQGRDQKDSAGCS